LPEGTELIPEWLARQVLSMSDDAIYVIDDGLNVVAANQTIEKWAQKNGSKMSIAGKNIIDALPFLNEKAITDVKMVLKTSKPLLTEYVWPLEQNKIISAQIVPLFTYDSQVQAITVARDIGEQKKILNGIIKRELAARLLLEQATDGIHIYTVNGKLLYVNEALCSRLGYTLDEFMMLRSIDVDISANEERFPLIQQEMLAKGRLFYETLFITKDGRKLNTEVSSSIVQYYGDAVILSISRDVTERRIVIDGLTRGLATLVEAQSVARVGSWDWRIKEDTYEWSSGMYSILEIDPQPVKNDTLYDYIHIDDVDRIQNAVQEAVNEKKEFDVAFRLILKDGREKVVRGIGKVICDEDDEVIRFFGTLTDITEMHAIRYELEKSNRDLELYASLLQHDLRNDLHLILTQAELSLSQSPENDEETKALTVIQTATERMSRMLEMFALSTEISKKDIIGMLSSAAADAQALNPNLKIDLVKDTDVESIRVSAGRLLPLVWTNLLRNAVNFAGSNANVRMAISRNEKGVLIDIADNGPGVSDSISNKLFEKGVTTTGSGYGLYLCRKIVEAYGGTIELVKQKGKGATFRVTLIPV
jgi:PAS domain S-box-containing protein